MAGTILATLNATAQSDNTAMTAGNSGFSLLQPGSGNTAIHLAAAKMGEAAGYRLTQGGANQNLAYLDLGSAQSIFAWRTPFRFSSVAAQCAIFRAYPATDHVTNLWTINLTTAGRLQAVEGSGTMNVTSPSGSALSSATDYVGLGLFNSSSGAWSFRVYARASTSLIFDLTGTCSAPQAVASVRWAIGNASSLATLDTNNAFAIGSSDYLARSDVGSTALAVAPTCSPSSGPPSTNFAFAANPSGGNGNSISYAWNFGDGNTGTGATPTHTYAVAGSYNWTVDATQS